MPASTYMPDVVVEAAFGSGFATPDVSRSWTDISSYVELDQLINIGYGRGDEFGNCDANTLSLTLNNTDGRFTMGRTSSPYYPDVKIGTPIRVRSIPVTGSTSTRFVGYVDEWPVGFPDASTGLVYSQPTASSRLARLGNGTEVVSGIVAERLRDNPIAYYPLSEPEGATQAEDISGNLQPPLKMVGSGTDVVFGSATGPGTDDATAATFAGGKRLQADLFEPPVELTIECMFNSSSAPGYGQRLAQCSGYGLALSTTGGLQLLQGATVIVASGSGYNDGATHHVAATITATTAELFINGASVGTAATTPTFVTGVDAGGYGPDILPPAADALLVLDGSLSHLTIYDYDLNAVRIAAHAQGRNLADTEAVGDAIARLARYGGVPDTEVDTTTTGKEMPYIQTNGMTPLDGLRIIETTQQGVLHDARDGDLRFRTIADRYDATSAFTLNVTNQQVEGDVSLTGDRQALINEATVTLRNGGGTATYKDQTSIDAYGRAAVSVEIDVADPNEAIGLASWLVESYKEPITRLPQLSIDLLTFSAANQALILAAEVGTRFAVSNWPSILASTTGDYFIEGYTETIGPESYRFTYNLSDASTWVDVWTIDDNVKGVLDAGYRIAY